MPAISRCRALTYQTSFSSSPFRLFPEQVVLLLPVDRVGVQLLQLLVHRLGRHHEARGAQELGFQQAHERERRHDRPRSWCCRRYCCCWAFASLRRCRWRLHGPALHQSRQASPGFGRRLAVGCSFVCVALQAHTPRHVSKRFFAGPRCQLLWDKRRIIKYQENDCRLWEEKREM